ncbi:hypothetical protein [Sinirhodobacter huangdaonensis]|uniref:Uncharacterized protein n=1 Tax=Paenirhodobacter huangdaonensis TaxID=2501515 RepID=A0A3S3LVF9_9RHOB|nr:hypothetical protein [Sinirhodobacter huangdaonensis]RWR54028.1 hypothetical protein EOW66_05295 [Sinirhodobacter huangdaonensis]
MDKETFSEVRIANAFKPNVELSDQDIAEMRRRMAASNREWKKRKKREEIEGGFDPKEADRQRQFAASKKRRNNKGMRRDLSELEIAQLKSAWVAE